MLLIFLQFINLAVDLACNVIEDDGDRRFSQIVLWFDLDRDELLAFLRLLHIALFAQEIAIIQLFVMVHFDDNFVRLLLIAVRAFLRKDFLKRCILVRLLYLLNDLL